MSIQLYTGDIYITDFDPDGDFSAQKLVIRLAPSVGDHFIRLDIAE